MVTSLLAASCACNVYASTPTGGWVLQNNSFASRDYAIRIDVDPGGKFPSESGAPPSVQWTHEFLMLGYKLNVGLTLNLGGYLGLERIAGVKKVVAEFIDAIDVKPGDVPAGQACHGRRRCKILEGPYDWKPGHIYRFRLEESPRIPPSESGVWWQITLADLTSHTALFLGEIKTKNLTGLYRESWSELKYLGGPFSYKSMRHARAMIGQTRGKYGEDAALKSTHASNAEDEDTCPPSKILPHMSVSDYDSTASHEGGTLSSSKNNYRGLHKWGAFDKKANAGMIFARDPDAEQPYIFQAVHDGEYGNFPEEGSDNQDWRSIGKGYPIINDLLDRHQKLYIWSYRNNVEVKINDYFIYNNPYNGDTEFFSLKQRDPKYFPTDKIDNADWHYVGRYPMKNDVLASRLIVHGLNVRNPQGKKGWLYADAIQNAYFILRSEEKYSAFPKKGEDNSSWRYVGEHGL